MRRITSALVALALLTGCGGDDDDDADVEGLTVEEAEDAVARALLDEDDLGDAWDLTETIAPEDVDDASSFTDCLGADLTRRYITDELARSEQRTFRRDDEGVVASTTVAVSTVAFRDESVVEDLVELFRTETFAGCIADAFATSNGETELEFEVGEAELADDYLALDGVRSGHLRIPFRATAPGFEFDAEVDLILVSRGQLATSIATTALGGTVDGEDTARWAALLADRQRLDARH